MNENYISNGLNYCKLSCNQNLQKIIEWLRVESESMEYGEIGFTFIIHQGEIVKIKQLKELSLKLNNSK